MLFQELAKMPAMLALRRLAIPAMQVRLRQRRQGLGPPKRNMG